MSASYSVESFEGLRATSCNKAARTWQLYHIGKKKKNTAGKGEVGGKALVLYTPSHLEHIMCSCNKPLKTARRPRRPHLI
jgi:hypothetical protein